MPSLSNIIPGSSLNGLVASQLTEGSVYRMRLTEEEGVRGKNPGDNGRNKYFIVLGVTDDGDVIGVVLINSHVNDNLPSTIKDLHYPISPHTYSFLSNNSFVDCSRIKELKMDKFTSKFNIDSKKGEITEEDMGLIKDAVRSSSLVTKKELRKYGLI